MLKLKPYALGLALAGLLIVSAGAAEKVAPKVNDALTYPPPGAVKFSGWIGQEMDICKEGRIFGQSLPDIIRPFAVREEDKLWREEFWGKWFTSAVLAYRYEADPKLKAVIDQAAQGLIATQTPDGAITTYKPEAVFSNWDTWGRKYTLLGLLAYYEMTGDTKTLEAARRHADVVLAHFGPGKANIALNGWWTGMAACSILEPMVLLHRATGEKKYLEFAEYIVSAWEDPKGPDLLRKALSGVSVFKMFPGPNPKEKGYMSGGSSKAYEMMSNYEGLIELHRVTGEPKYLEAAKKVFADIRDTEITIIGSGSSWERWCNGRTRQTEDVPEWMETCVTVTWLKFAAQLLRISGDPAYADEIERSAYNPLLGAQKTDGTWWRHYNPLEGVCESAPEHCNMHMNCCVANGPRGLLLMPALTFMTAASGPVVNFYEPGSATLPLASGKTVKLAIASDYPRPGAIEITVMPEAAEKFTLSLRIPSWTSTAKVEINGQPVNNVKPGAYARLERDWKPGDKVRLTFDYTVRLVKDPGGSKRVAVMRGPVVFALDKRITQPGQGQGAVIVDAAGVIAASEVKSGLPKGIRMALDVPVEADGRRASVRLCDYASAGRTWAEDSTLRVWLPQPLNLGNPFEGIAPPKKQ